MLLIGALLVAALAVLLLRHPDRAGRTWDDARAMREGEADAQAIQSPDDLLAWVAAHPTHASLVVLRADGSELLAYEPDRRRPVTALPVLWSVAEWAEAGTYLDGAAVSREARATRRLLAPESGTPDADTLSVAEVVARAVQGDRAAASVLRDGLGPARLAVRAGAYGSEPPVPFEGLLLAWAEGDTTGRSAPALARRLLEDAPFRTDARARFASGDAARSLREQRAFAAASFPEGTAHGYARLFADALAGRFATADASQRFLGATALSASGSARAGAQGGGFPGHLAFAAWAQTPEHPDGRAAVLILSDLPLGLFYHLSRTGLDAALVLDLVTADRSEWGG